MRSSLLPVFATFAVVAGLNFSVQAEGIGQLVKGFELDDYRGKSYSLSDFDDSKLVLVAFTGTHCPLAKAL